METPGKAALLPCGLKVRIWWTQQKLLDVDVMTDHWNVTCGEACMKKIIDGDFAGSVDFLAQDVNTSDFGDAVFKPCLIKHMNDVRVVIVPQAFPYTPIANPS